MKCSICGKEIIGYGNRPYPVRIGEENRCCDMCNDLYVLPARIALLNSEVEDVAERLNTMSQEELDILFNINK